MLYGVLGALEHLLYRVVGQRLQPQFLDLLELLGVRVGGVVLVVVIQAKQGKNLVDRLYAGLCVRFAPAVLFSLPRRCR